MMKKLWVICLVLMFSMSVAGQKNKIPKTRFVTGLAGPELLHAGLTYRIANIIQIGFNGGIGPTYGQIWPAIRLENRLYFGENNEKVNYKTWFCRQGTTFFPSAEKPSQFTFNLTIGKDIPSRNNKDRIKIDFGVFI